MLTTLLEATILISSNKQLAIHSQAYPARNLMRLATLLLVVACLSACGNKDKKAGQTLARVDGEDITVLLLNNELKHAGIQDGQLEEGRKQLLESLIDRQLIVAEAMRKKIDRTPEVMQSIEQAKSQIIAQVYLQNITSIISKPSKVEINGYYQKHPEFFSRRKEFHLKQLVIPNKNFSAELYSFIDSTKSLEDTAFWLDKHDVPYTRGQVIRSTADLPQTTVTRLLSLPKGKIFLASDEENKVLNVITAIKDMPVSAINAELQIERFLSNQMQQEAVNAELAHLRSLAKIEYLITPANTATQTMPNKKTADAR